MSYNLVIEEKLDILLRCTNINVKIIACLQADNGLNEDQVSEIETAKALRKQCQLLYGWMKSSEKLYECFVNVVEKNDQLHVANFLKGSNDEPHVPLSIQRYERLIRIKPKLMDSIHNSEHLLASLEAKKAISVTDCQDVRVDLLAKYKRNYILTNAIQRRSNHSFICLDEALRETHQHHVADYLTEGEVVTVHVNTNYPGLDDQLSQALNEILVKEYAAVPASKGTVLGELNGINSHLLSSKPEKSIMIFLYCKTTDDMMLFMKAFNSGSLRSIIGRIFNRLMSSLPNKPKGALEVKLRLDDEEVLLIEEFTGNDDWIPGRFHSRPCVDMSIRAIKDEPASKTEKRSYGSASRKSEVSSKRRKVVAMLDDTPMSQKSAYGSRHLPELRNAASYEPLSTSARMRKMEYIPRWRWTMKPNYNADVLPLITQAKSDATKTMTTIRKLERKMKPFLDFAEKTKTPAHNTSDSLLEKREKMKLTKKDQVHDRFTT